jgi:hypothetical protein
MSENKKPPFLGEASVDTRFLVEAMRKVAPGEIITYEALNDACGRDVREKTHLTTSARRILMRDHSMVFRCVPNEGFMRLEDQKIVEVVNVDRRERMRRQASMAIQELGCVEYDKLPSPDQLAHNTGIALFGSLYQATSKRSAQKLQQRVVNAGGEIDMTGTLKLIGWMA